MRTANDDGRLAIQTADGLVDVETASDGLFAADPQAVYDRWEEFRAWAARTDPRPVLPLPLDVRRLGPAVTRPRQVFAFGLNYADHAAESGFEAPEGLPPVFTKFASAITGPVTTVALPQGDVDWEVELAVVIGRECRHVDEADAWDAVAGVTVAQDLSERVLQLSGPAPQFSLGKSHAGFLPLGGTLTTPDALPDRDAIELTCSIDGVEVQRGNTRDLIVPVPRLISRLSDVVTLFPGDLVLTGTPAGVGIGRTPPRFLQPGETLVSTIEGVGVLEQTFTGSIHGS